jgi:outer membrane biosynthesis protein TonB
VTEAVSDVLELRAAPEAGFTRAVTASIGVHLMGVIALFLAHQYVVTHRPIPPKIMTITLGGSIGPRSTGMTAASPRPVDQVAPPKREPVKTAASQSSVMTLPVKSEPKPAPQVDQTLPITSVPKPPTTGAQVRPGTSRAETGSTTQDKGLTVGGAGGSAAILEVKDFCCPEYIQRLLQRIENTWNKNVPGRGYTILKFTVRRDGSITDISTDETTNQFFENQSRSALVLARSVPPLPAEFKDDHLVIHLRFPYGIK